MERGGGTPITDATATPSDVVNGKVFYNNDGRQVGTKDAGLKVLSTTVPYNSIPPLAHCDYATTVIYDYDGAPRNASVISENRAFPTNKTLALNATKLLYFTYSYCPGIIFNILYGGQFNNFICLIQPYGESILDFGYANGIVHLNTRVSQCNGAVITIYYI